MDFGYVWILGLWILGVWILGVWILGVWIWGDPPDEQMPRSTGGFLR
jgi:hypothetical protein